MFWIQSYACASGGGNSTDELWSNLMAGGDRGTSDFLFAGARPDSIEKLLREKLLGVYRSLEHRPQPRLGVILASTKGLSNDFVWKTQDPRAARDPISPLLEGFLADSGLTPERSLTVSNACSSTLAALALGQAWLDQGLNEVLILAADAVSPFVNKGFASLKLLTDTGIRPFTAERNGFRLGDGAAALVLSSRFEPGSVALRRVGLDTEGSAVTRPSHSGDSLCAAAWRIPRLRQEPPTAVIAHGTGTRINDETEDLAFSRLFEGVEDPWVTGTKWLVGHTLAASGAIDLIAACEALKRQELFALATSSAIDPAFRSKFFTGAGRKISLQRMLISSLGFGGMHAMALVEIPQ